MRRSPYREDARPTARGQEVSAAGLNLLLVILALLIAPVVLAGLAVLASFLPDAILTPALPWTGAGSCAVIFGIFLILNATVAGTIRRYFGVSSGAPRDDDHAYRSVPEHEPARGSRTAD